MDSKDIEQLLERYWQCETSIEEEARLRDFFNGHSVPRHLLRYKDLFVYQQLQQEEGLSKEFEARVLAQVEAPVVKARRLTFATRLIPLFKAAAVVAVILSLGNMAQHALFPTPDDMAVANDTIGKQMNAPSVAQSGNAAGSYSQPLDSLERMEQVLKQTKEDQENTLLE